MKLLQLYNQYRSLHGGEETVVMMTDALMKSRGHQARLLMRSSRGLDESLWGKVQAFAGAYYNRAAYREVAAAIEADRPDVVHVHNLYPRFSPSVLVACQRAAVPVVMTNHNYMLTCPMTHHLRHGSVCEKCIGGREIHCLLNNCRNNWAESFAYASRSWYARRKRLFSNNVDVHIVLTEFAKRQLVRGGFSAENIAVLPNMVEFEHQPADAAEGEYVAFSGRIDKEKGVDDLLAAMRKLPDVPLKLAGHGPLLDDLRADAPANCQFLGRLNSDEMIDFYQRARMVVIPSRWYEGCPLVVSEAMSHAIPLVVSRIGGLPELVDDGQCGCVFEQGNVDALAEQIDALWNSPEQCRQLGLAGRAKAAAEYAEAVYYERLMGVYARAMRRSTADLLRDQATSEFEFRRTPVETGSPMGV